MGCGCATMSRNDPPHLVAILDLLRKGTPPDLNHVLPGDAVNEITGTRERLAAGRARGARARRPPRARADDRDHRKRRLEPEHGRPVARRAQSA